MKTILGLFRNYSDAEESIRELNRLGLSSSEVGLLAASNGKSPADKYSKPAQLSQVELPGLGRVQANASMLNFLDTRDARKDSQGVYGMLLRMGIPRDDAAGYLDGIKQGGVFEAFDVPDEKEADALAIMRTRTQGTTERRLVEEKRQYEERPAERRYEQRVCEKTPELVIPIVEEELYVGKREVPSSVRLDTRITTEPVEKTISLKEERIQVERRGVDRLADANLASDPNLFSERSFEFKAMAEEPVINKRARIVEEVRVHKDRQERTETIRDVLRHTEVEINEDRGLETSRYTDHFKKYYGSQDLSFERVAPAYEFGERLRRRSSHGDWSSIEGRVSESWESKNPGTWQRFKEAIRAGWEGGAKD